MENRRLCTISQFKQTFNSFFHKELSSITIIVSIFLDPLAAKPIDDWENAFNSDAENQAAAANAMSSDDEMPGMEENFEAIEAVIVNYINDQFPYGPHQPNDYSPNSQFKRQFDSLPEFERMAVVAAFMQMTEKREDRVQEVDCLTIVGKENIDCPSVEAVRKLRGSRGYRKARKNFWIECMNVFKCGEKSKK